MKNLIVIAALAAAASLSAQSITRVEQVAPDVTLTHEKLDRQLAPSAKQKLQSAASILLTQVDPKQSDASITQVAGVALNSAFPGTGAQDIDAMLFLVMYEAASQDEAELKAITTELQKTSAQKAELRATLAKANSAKSVARPPHVSVVAVVPRTHVNTPPPLPPNATPAAMQQRLDELSDMSQANQLRMQMITDRRAKLLEMLSNVSRKMSTTADGVVSKMK